MPKCRHIGLLTLCQSASDQRFLDAGPTFWGETDMHSLMRVDRGLGLVMFLNWDRVLSVFAIFLALVAGAWAASLLA